MNPYFRKPKATAESMTPEERHFVEAVLGKVIRTERETLQWVAQFSDRHAAELRRLREAEADAQRGQASGEAPPAGVFSLLGIVRESGGWAARPPRSLEEFEAWNQAQLLALRELEAEVRAAADRQPPPRPDFEIAEGAWDPAKHPRLGASPNAGWFTSKGGATSAGPAASGGGGGILPEVCFAAGTSVLTDNGFKPIELVLSGDRVLAAFEGDAEGATGYWSVEEVHHQPPRDVIGVDVGGHVIRCTPHHPFYVIGRGWVAAGRLDPGDRLVSSARDEVVRVTGVLDNGDAEPVYNLRVPGACTYFIGTLDPARGVLVHNDSDDPDGDIAAPEGNEQNHFNGLGEWEFKNSDEAEAFLAKLLQADKNKLPEDWATVAKDGCVGLNLMRIGYAGAGPLGGALLRKTPPVPFFASEDEAREELEKLRAANPDKQYALVAAQLPTTGNPDEVVKTLGPGPIDPKTSKLNLDKDKGGSFNYATWFSAGDSGYWEYMNHRWDAEGFRNTNDLPHVKHKTSLPDMGKKYLTLYGAAEILPWPKK